MKKMSLVVLPVLMFSCVHINNTADTRVKQNIEFFKKWENAVRVKDINEAPLFYNGEKVLVRGKVVGWKECSKSARITRSDVVIIDADVFSNAKYCLYIKGGVNPKFWGKMVALKGIVRVKNGKPYLDNAEVIDAK